MQDRKAVEKKKEEDKAKEKQKEELSKQRQIEKVIFFLPFNTNLALFPCYNECAEYAEQPGGVFSL